MKTFIALVCTFFISSVTTYGVSEVEDMSSEEQLSAEDMRSFLTGKYRKAEKELKDNWGERKYSEVEIDYIKKDLCFTTHVLGECTLEGPELNFSVPVFGDTIFLYGRIADIKTKDGTRDDGKPYYETLELEVGVGAEINLTNSINLVAKVGYNSASDTEWWAGNNGKSVKQGNYNDGVKFQAKIKKMLNKHIMLCAGYIQDHSQNSSNSKQHGLKDKKPKMKFGQVELCGSIKVTENLYITTSIKKMVKKPTKNRSNEFDAYHPQELPDEPDYSIGFKYVFK